MRGIGSESIQSTQRKRKYQWTFGYTDIQKLRIFGEEEKAKKRNKEVEEERVFREKRMRGRGKKGSHFDSLTFHFWGLSEVLFFYFFSMYFGTENEKEQERRKGDRRWMVVDIREEFEKFGDSGVQSFRGTKVRNYISSRLLESVYYSNFTVKRHLKT